MTRARELQDMNDDELAHRLAEAREEVFNLRFQLAMGKQDNSARLGHVRRDVARVLTIQHQRRAAGNVGTEPSEPKTSRAAKPSSKRKVAR